MDLEYKILKHTAKVGIIGMGYVGLPLGVEMAKVGYQVYGVDVDKTKIRLINSGKSFIEDVTSEELAPLVRSKMIVCYEDYKICKKCDIINICVPTPFTKSKDPDVSFIIDSGKEISKYLKKGQLIILRSTTYPETTEKVLLPILEKTGLKAGKDFYLSFAPERIDPGNKVFTTKTTPVVVGGLTKTCTDLSAKFYREFVDKVVPVSNPRVAEMSKLLENIFRSVNIALVNELALMCERMGNLDVWEVIEAAKSKPFGFMPFYPGPGIGGHCILIDPYYLAWKAREYDFHSNFIELAAQVNENMPFKVVDRLFEIFGENGIGSKTASLFIIGAAFKKNVGDTRHSPAIKVMGLIANKVKKIAYNDPFVPSLKINGKTYRSVKLSAEALKKADCVLVLTNHDLYDAKFILKHSRLILDTRNLIKPRGQKKVYTLGLK
ncbi:MAG: nucleotide sugar dehydrogenase [Candidatus Latescibacteria bacterium]|nr:nucleotide sugar dehydrogenase [Candidatus Latescibacterota bacterium]